MKTKQGYIEKDYSKYLLTSVSQKNIPPVSEAYPYVKSSAQSVRLGTLHETFPNSPQTIVVQGIVEVAPTKSFFIKIAYKSSQHVMISTVMMVAVCLEVTKSWLELQDVALQMQTTRPENSVNDTQIYKAPELM